MDIGIVSSRYAKALYKFAEANQEADRVYAEMQKLAQAFLDASNFRAVLLNPVLTGGQKKKLLLAAMGRENAVSASVLKFVELVIAKKRVSIMQFISNAYVRLYQNQKGIVKGRLTLPVAVSKAVEQRLQEAIENRAGKKLDFDMKIDEELLGGFVLEYDTYRLDASLKRQLEEIQRSLTRV